MLLLFAALVTLATGQTDNNNNGACEGIVDGLVPGNTCSEFLSCRNGTVVGGANFCTGGSLFDVESQRCRFLPDVSCDDRATGDNPCALAQPWANVRDGESFNIEVPGICNKFYICGNRVLKGVVFCGEGTVFDQGRCVQPVDAAEQEAICAGKTVIEHGFKTG